MIRAALNLSAKANTATVPRAALTVLTLLFLALAPLVLAAAVSPQPTTPGLKKPTPSPELEPSAVVRIQVEALRSNSYLNEGIELTYGFASPENQRFTGPLPRFIEMVRSTPYDRLLNHRSARYGPLAVSRDEAYQIVIITDQAGEDVAYLWVLSRQSEGEFKDCWMTAAVISAEQPGLSEYAQISPG